MRLSNPRRRGPGPGRAPGAPAEAAQEAQLRAALVELERARKAKEQAELAWQAELARVLKAKPASIELSPAKLAAFGLPM